MIYSEPGPGCVLTWFAQFQRGDRRYQYAAVHIEGKGWYTTDTIHDNPITWAALRIRIGRSRCFAVTGWAEIPHVLEGETVTHALPGGGHG
jgi:hypothetical protein